MTWVLIILLRMQPRTYLNSLLWTDKRYPCTNESSSRLEKQNTADANDLTKQIASAKLVADVSNYPRHGKVWKTIACMQCNAT